VRNEGTRGEREGNMTPQHGSLGGVQDSSELNNEGTGREREWNMETQHGSLGGRAILSSELKK
jgi:hypothetical protein